MAKRFYEKPTPQSMSKATIVSKYFASWAQVMIRTLDPGKPMYYIDLFSGPGKYDDDTKSTPLLVIDEALKDDKLPHQLIMVFNDKNPDYVSSLEDTVNNYPGIERFKHLPRFWNDEVGVETVKRFRENQLPPTLLFVDPWGFKGLSLDLLNAVLPNWGCDAIFFFNYNRVNMRINRADAIENMNTLFGPERAETLRETLDSLPPSERESMMVEELSQALKETSGQGTQRYVLPFRFVMSDGKKTSHHLVFVSEHFLGYDIMKDIMAKQSSTIDQGMASFEYNPATHNLQLLFSLTRPSEDLEDMLLTDYAGRSAKFEEIYEEHSVDTAFMRGHYRKVLWDLFNRGIITAEPRPKRKNTFAKHIVATFPSKP